MAKENIISSHGRPLHIFVMYALSAVTGNAFPQLLTSLSMAKERYYQSLHVLTMYLLTIYILSPVADNTFPSRLTSLSKQRKSIISHRAS